jgi:hypothetical protein
MPFALPTGMTIDKNRGTAWLVLALAAAAATACADPSQSLFPTGPSGLIAPSPAFRPAEPSFAPLQNGGRDSGVTAQ